MYGWEISGYLPYGGFKWLKNVGGSDVASIGKKSQISYILEVDLEYPDELHELHDNYPLAPEKCAVFDDMLSRYCKKIADECEIKVGNVKKLIPNLGNKTSYVVHYKNLQLYLSLKMKLSKIHEVLKFTSRLTQLSHKMFDKIFATIYEIKSILMLNKLLHVGFTVLEIS